MPRLPLVYVGLLGAALAVGFVSWPIVAADTDLWFHLNAGRFIAANGALPQTAFFSFIRPSPAWLDYSWLSQVLFYGVHSAGGYLGLVELRALAALATYALILATLRTGQRGEGWGWTAIVFTAAALFLVGRLTMLRPGNFSYLSIAAFLFVLESRRGLLALPALALAWVNLHGIEYPVMLLILGAYLGEWTLARFGLLAGVAAPPWRAFAAAGAAGLALLATPYGVGVLAAPFMSVGFLPLYIKELKPPDLGGLLSLSLDGLYLPRAGFLALLVAASALAAAVSLQRARLRPAHLVLVAGGAVLLWRAERFATEFVLLAIPLLAAFRPRLALAPAVAAPLRIALAIGVAALPFWHLYKVLETDCAFPLCGRDLPAGSVAFLKQVGATGTVLNHPNDGGYLEWELSPRQQIFVDMQSPYLFSHRDVFVGSQMFGDPRVFAGVVAQYRPAFVLAPRRARDFGRFAGQVADYVPVFADDASVLYADARAQAELVAGHALSAIDPHALLITGDRAEAAAQLARANALYPDGARLRVFEGELALERGDTEAALRSADAVLERHPASADALRLRGDALFRSGRLADAAQAYEAALAGLTADATAQDKFDLETRLWSGYTRLGRPDRAYAVLRSALGDLYRSAVGYRELAALATAALDAGDMEIGRTLVQFALAKTPASETELRRSLEARLAATRPRTD